MVMRNEADVIIVGAGLAGLVAAAELVDAGRRVCIVEQEPETNLGGQAYWSFGGLFFVDSPLQRRMGIRDSRDLALRDWLGTAGFDRPEDYWPRRWAEAYVDFAAGEQYSWLRQQGMRFFPIVGWAERGGSFATGSGNSVPRFHITWGTGPGVLEPFIRRVRDGEARGLVTYRFRHRVTSLHIRGGVVEGVEGEILEPEGPVPAVGAPEASHATGGSNSSSARGMPTSRTVVGNFRFGAQAVIVTSGGIGGNHDLVRRNWPARMGTAPERMLCGVPAYVDGLMQQAVAAQGGQIINPDRMWHYPEGIENFAPIWPLHAIRILAGPSPLWLDERGQRLPAPYYPGFDTLGALQYITTGSGYTGVAGSQVARCQSGAAGGQYSWFLLNQRIIEHEFALSGSEQNPDLTGRSLRKTLSRVLPGAPAPIEAFKQHGQDFIVRRTLPDLVAAMNALTGQDQISLGRLRDMVDARDGEMSNPFGKDAQMMAIRGARAYLGDRLIRVAKPHRLLDPSAGPLIAVRLWVLTRKTLGGLATDLDGRVLQASGEPGASAAGLPAQEGHANHPQQSGAPIPGLYAAGEVAGFGGGGMHGYRSLEGTFLGGCIFSGRVAGRAAARAVSGR